MARLTCSISIIFNLVSITKGYASPLTPPGDCCNSDEDDEPVATVVTILNADFDLFNNGGGCLRPLLPPSVSPVTTAPTSPIADLIAPIPSARKQYKSHLVYLLFTMSVVLISVMIYLFIYL